MLHNHALHVSRSFGAALITLIFYWNNLRLLFPLVPEVVVIGFATAAAMPSIWLLDFGRLWFIGLLGVCACLLIVSTTVVIFFQAYLSTAGPFDVSLTSIDVGSGMSDTHAIQLAQMPVAPLSLEWIGRGLSVSIGIYALSLAGHAALPGIYGAMSEPSKYRVAVNISFTLMFLIYTLEAVSGYLAFGWLRGEKIDILISTNIAAHSMGSPLTTTMTAAVVAKSYCSISPLMAIISELPETLIGAHILMTPFKRQALRSFLLLFSSAVAYPCAVYNLLPMVEALTGASCSMFASVVLPSTFWVMCHKDAKGS